MELGTHKRPRPAAQMSASQPDPREGSWPGYTTSCETSSLVCVCGCSFSRFNGQMEGTAMGAGHIREPRSPNPTTQYFCPPGAGRLGIPPGPITEEQPGRWPAGRRAGRVMGGSGSARQAPSIKSRKACTATAESHGRVPRVTMRKPALPPAWG